MVSRSGGGVHSEKSGDDACVMFCGTQEVLGGFEDQIDWNSLTVSNLNSDIKYNPTVLLLLLYQYMQPTMW